MATKAVRITTLRKDVRVLSNKVFKASPQELDKMVEKMYQDCRHSKYPNVWGNPRFWSGLNDKHSILLDMSGVKDTQISIASGYLDSVQKDLQKKGKLPSKSKALKTAKDEQHNIDYVKGLNYKWLSIQNDTGKVTPPMAHDVYNLFYLIQENLDRIKAGKLVF